VVEFGAKPLLVMCSYSKKKWASLVIEAEAEGEAEGGSEEELSGTEVVAEAGVRGKCKGVKTWPLYEQFFYCRDRTKYTSYSEKLSFIFLILPYLFTLLFLLM